MKRKYKVHILQAFLYGFLFSGTVCFLIMLSGLEIKLAAGIGYGGGFLFMLSIIFTTDVKPVLAKGYGKD